MDTEYIVENPTPPAGEIVEQPKVLTREEILAVNDCKTEWVDVPAWGGQIKVRGLTVREIDSIMKMASHKGTVDTAKSAVLMLIRATVEPKFTDMDMDDLKNKSAVVLQIVKKINLLSGISDDALEQAEKN